MVRVPIRESGSTQQTYQTRWVLTRDDQIAEVPITRNRTTTIQSSRVTPTVPKAVVKTGTQKPAVNRFTGSKMPRPRPKHEMKPVFRRPKPWVAPKRRAANDNDTIIKLSLDTARTLSYIRFKLLDTPCTWKVYYLDSETNTMRPLTDSLDEPLQGELDGHEDNLDIDDDDEDRHRHEHHHKRGLGHHKKGEGPDESAMIWVTIEELLTRVQTKLIEIHIKRKLIYPYIQNGNDRARESGRGHKYGLYRTVPYRIGIKEFEAKVIVLRTETRIIYDPEIIADEIVEIDYNNPNQAIDRDIVSAWVSSPQAAAKSIVPFYLDLRSDNNTPITFDTMDIVPLYPGPLFNVYYSNDDTVPEFVVSNSIYDMLTESEEADGISFEENNGLYYESSTSHVRVLNDKIRLNLEDDFSFGMEWFPDESVFSAPASTYSLFTIDGSNNIVLRYSVGSKIFSVIQGSTTLVQSTPITLLSGNSYSVVVTCENDTWSIRAMEAEGKTLVTVKAATTENVTLFGPQTIDGIALTPGNRVLVKNQTNLKENGLYIVYSNEWFRTEDFDTSDEFTNALYVYVEQGSQAETSWVITSATPITLGTSNITFGLAANPREGLGSTVVTKTPWTTFWPSSIVIGNNKDKNDAAIGHIRNVWVKLNAVDDRVIDTFVASPTKFALRSDGSTISAQYRGVFLAPFKRNTKAACGPGTDFYEKKKWIPLADDYKLGNTTTYDLPLVTAKYLALEFTNLVGEFYKPSSNEMFELRDFKSDIKAYYRSLPNSYGRFASDPIMNLFEGVRVNFTEKVAGKDLPSLRDVLTYGDGGPVFIYTHDQSTIDYFKNPNQYDRMTTLEELRFAAKLMKFFKNESHDYDLSYVFPEVDRAYFVGIKDLRLHRSAQDIAFDTPEYFETFKDVENIDTVLSSNYRFIQTSADDAFVESGTEYSVTFQDTNNTVGLSNHGLINGTPIVFTSVTSTTGVDSDTTYYVINSTTNNFKIATTVDGSALDLSTDGTGTMLVMNQQATIVSKNFKSISSFSGLQMAVFDGPWKTTMEDDEIDLVSLTGIQGIHATIQAEPLSLYQGSSVGNVISVTKTSSRYGIKSETLAYSPKAKQRISGAIRILTDKAGTGKGKYILKLIGTKNSQEMLLASRDIDLSTNWQEVDIIYIAEGNESDIYLEVIQIDERYSPTFAVDMMGMWYNPVIWEVSNNNGSTYMVPALTFGNMNGFVKFQGAGNQLRVRITVTESGIPLSTWSIVPDYKLTYLLKRNNSISTAPWTSSDNPRMRAVMDNPYYKMQARPWPNKFSTSR